MHKLVKDELGKKYHKLLVVKYAGSNKSGKAQWRCLCDCGNEAIITGDNLRNGHTKSCGCIRTYTVAKNNRSRRLPPGQAEFNAWFYRYKKCASERDLVFALTEREFKNITKMNCFYCDAPPTEHKQLSYNSTPYIGNGIDRLDSNKGYTLSNVVPCCKVCNFMKSNRTVTEFLTQIIQIYKHLELD